ncbi:MAG: apolipoprotein N-acyltransferase, partial [Planctomycetes bacterium]|nr:apolipoprotein N-acyltransferase [Planctomycetota bacterium]
MDPLTQTAHKSAEVDARPTRLGLIRRTRLSLRAFWTELRAAGPELALFSVLSGVTVVLFSLIFPPLSMWPVAFFCLAPWAYAVCAIRRAWVLHWGSFLVGWIAFLINLTWMFPVTGLGYTALAFYLAVFWPLTGWAMRTGLRIGVPLWLSLPTVWVGCEFLRAIIMTGFPWLFLAHAFYENLPFIQISDLVGAYGVTFLAAMVCGWLADIALWVRPRWAKQPDRMRVASGAAAVLLCVGGNLAYGSYRLGQSQFEKGPRVAVIQEDFPLSTSAPIAPHHFTLARQFVLAVESLRDDPDIIAFPETAWTATQNLDFVELPLKSAEGATDLPFGKRCHELTSALARGEYGSINKQFTSWEIRMREIAADDARARPYATFPRLSPISGRPVSLVVGALARDVMPEPVTQRQKRYNSALIYDPDGTQRPERYDKMHLVPLGEIVPFRNKKFLGMDLHWLYRALNDLSPFSDNGKFEYSLSIGAHAHVFTLRVGGRDWRFGTPICYEDVMPYVSRRFVWKDGRRQCDFLINISNDGWFLHSAELPQHLASAVFRAVENRVGIARAVNTGISGFIAPDGRVYSKVEINGVSQAPGITGYRVD